jgi:hypothetical protein
MSKTPIVNRGSDRQLQQKAETDVAVVKKGRTDQT